MQTADAYFLVHQNRGVYAASLYTVGRGRELTSRIATLGRDLAPPFEVDRARNLLADLEQQAVSARQNWRQQSARLTRVLRLDPRAVVEPLEHDHAQVTLIDPGRALDDLMAVALTNRPEVSSRRAMVAAAEAGIRLQKGKPLIPSFAINGFQTPFEMLQAGIFGIGPNSGLNQWSGRDDFSLQPLFQLQNLGIGNLAQIKVARGTQSLAIIDYYDAQDQVAEEVTQTLARLQSAAVRVFQAERALRTGIITYNGTVEGLEQTSRFQGDVLVLISRPQEAVYALQLLQRAFVEYYSTVAEYNRSQFALFHALGYPAQEITRERLPGEAVPVDLTRPSHLPPVGNGPPPATR
jgi:outer membrane protein TolC